MVIWRLQQGTARAIRGEKVYDLTPGRWLFLAGGGYRQEFSREAHLDSLHTQLMWPDRRSLFPPQDDRVIDEVRGRSLHEPYQQCIDHCRAKDMARHHGVALSRLRMTDFVRIQTNLLRFLAEAAEILERERPALNFSFPDAGLAGEIVQRLEQYATEPRLDRASLAKAFGLSVSSLDRLLLDHIGITPYGYWERSRLMAIQDRVFRRDQPLKEIAFDFGFTSQAAFSNWFRRKVGESPRSTRDSHRLPELERNPLGQENTFAEAFLETVASNDGDGRSDPPGQGEHAVHRP